MSFKYILPEQPNDTEKGGWLRFSAEVSVDPNNEFLRATENAQLILDLISEGLSDILLELSETQDAAVGRMKALVFLAGLTNVRVEFDQIADPGAKLDFSES